MFPMYGLYDDEEEEEDKKEQDDSKDDRPNCDKDCAAACSASAKSANQSSGLEPLQIVLTVLWSKLNVADLFLVNNISFSNEKECSDDLDEEAKEVFKESALISLKESADEEFTSKSVDPPSSLHSILLAERR